MLIWLADLNDLGGLLRRHVSDRFDDGTYLMAMALATGVLVKLALTNSLVVENDKVLV